MQNEIFFVIFALVAILSKRNRVAALVMALGLFLYVQLVNQMLNDRIYYMLTAALDVYIGLFMLSIYHATKQINVKYIGYLSFVSMFAHIYGRIVYELNTDPSLYVFICVSVMVAQLALMLARPIGGMVRRDNRDNILRLFDRDGFQRRLESQERQA